MYCPCKSYFTFITKEKLYFSLICSFYCCLVKGVWVLKVVWQFTTQGVVAYKLLIKKCIQPITLWGIFWCFWIIARNIKCGLIIHGEDSISRLFYKTILKVSLFFFLVRVKLLCNNNDRCSRPEDFCTNGVLKNFAKLTGKTLVSEFLF